MNWLSRLFSRPAARRIMSREEVREIVSTQMRAAGVDLDAINAMHIADPGYLGVTPEEAFAAVSDAAPFWMPETNDCDDHAHLAKAEIIVAQRRAGAAYPYALGVIWTQNHALNLYICPDRTLRLIENNGDQLPLTHLAGQPVHLLVM